MTKKFVAEKLYEDPRVQKAKELLKEVLVEHTSEIKSSKPATPELQDTFKETMEEFGKKRGGNLFYNYLGTGAGNGALVELMDGSIKYDFITGIGVHYFGHSHPGIMESVVDAALGNTIMHGHLQQNVDSTKLVDLILKGANLNGAGMDHCFLSTSGAMACENAMKIIFQKRFPAKRILAFDKCFMGRTLMLAQITDKAAYRQGLPKAVDVDYVPFYDANDHEGSIKRAVDILKKHLERHPCDHAAFCMELIQGEGGYFVGHPDFFNALIDVCQEAGISILVDEVQTFMRTEELFAYQYFKLDKRVDVVTIGKNSQVCATLFRKDHAPRPGLISQTFTSSTAAIKAGTYIINEVMNDGYLGKDGKINKMHNHFVSHLEALSKKYPDKIEGPWGLGAMVGMTLFKGDMEKSKEFTFKLFDNGALSFIAGREPTRVRFLLPMGAVTTDDIDNVAKLVDKTLGEMN